MHTLGECDLYNTDMSRTLIYLFCCSTRILSLKLVPDFYEARTFLQKMDNLDLTVVYKNNVVQ